MTIAERELLLGAMRWARQNGWQRRNNVWSSPYRAGQDSTYVYRRAARRHGSALVIARARHSPIHLTDIREAISVLAVLGLLPARFSSLGRNALLDHAVVCERFAEHLLGHNDARQGIRALYAAGLHRAATSAVRMAGAGTW